MSSLPGLRFPASEGEGEVPADDAECDVPEPCLAWLLAPTAAKVDWACGVALAEIVRVSERNWGVAWNAYGCTGEAVTPRYPGAWLLNMLLGVCPVRCGC